jgi:hypothetical protein
LTGAGFFGGFAEQTESQDREDLLKGGLFGGFVGTEAASAIATAVVAAAAAVWIVTTWATAIPAAPVVGSLRGIIV